MKTFRLFWRYLAKFFLEREMFEIKVVEKIKTYILCSVTSFRKSYRLWDNVERYSGDRGATNDVTIWRILVACWISKAIYTDAHAHAHEPRYPHTSKHARTHKPITNTYYNSTAAMIRQRATVLCYTYIACLVYLQQSTPRHWYF